MKPNASFADLGGLALFERGWTLLFLITDTNGLCMRTLSCKSGLVV